MLRILHLVQRGGMFIGAIEKYRTELYVFFNFCFDICDTSQGGNYVDGCRK